MASWLIILAIWIIVTALGSVIVLQFMPRRHWLTLSGLFAASTLGTVWAGWIALALAELGLYSLTLVLIIWAALFLFLWFLAVRRSGSLEGRFEQQEVVHKRMRVEDWLGLAVLVLWLAAALWLYFRPHEYILGGADSGVYVSLGAEIAQKGGFILQDASLASLDPALQELFLRPLPRNLIASSYIFPGFYVTDAAAGEVTPQFYPLHPIWQAVAFSLGSSTTAGVEAGLLITGLWMILASLAIILTAKELGGWPAAVLIMAALALTSLQVWFARYPTTEALTQFLLWSGLWALMRWLGGKQPAAFWAFVSGSALGAVFLVRIDILVLLPLFILLFVGLWLRGWRKSDWWFLAPFVLLVAHSFLHGILFSAPYFSEHIGFALRLLWRSWWLPVLAVIAGGVLLWLISRQRQRIDDLARFRKPLLFTLAGTFLLNALYGWFVRPVIQEASLYPDVYSETLLLITNHENWLRLGWYLAVPGVWLGVAGACLMIWRVERKTALLVATGALFSVVYLWSVRANPHHIYVMRRYIPAVVPFFLLAGAYFISQVPGLIRGLWRGSQDAGRSLGALTAVLLAAGWLAMLGWSARGFISQIDNQGVLQQLALINEDLPAHSILLFNEQTPVGIGDFWGTPLKYIFDHDAFKIRDEALLNQSPLAETIEFWQNSGRTVVWIGDPHWLSAQGFAYESVTYLIESRQMESSYEHKPQQIVPVSWKLEAAFTKPGRHNGAE